VGLQGPSPKIQTHKLEKAQPTSEAFVVWVYQKRGLGVRISTKEEEKEID